MQIDPRGQRFNAAVTTVVLAIALVTSSVWVVGFQTVVFALSAIIGLQASPYGWVYKKAVRPRIGPPSELEDAAPPRFAQTVGLVFGLVATVGFATGADLVGTIATAFALAAAFLNAAFGFCLGCEMYLIIRRVTHRTTPAAASAASKEVSA
jgi:hypothetical protein